MNDDDILTRGGNESDIESYAKQNGADMTTEPKQLTPTERVKDMRYETRPFIIYRLALDLAAELERVQKAFNHAIKPNRECADNLLGCQVERDELKRQVEEEKRLRALYYDERNRLQDENTELRKDKERLDWLENYFDADELYRRSHTDGISRHSIDESMKGNQ